MEEPIYIGDRYFRERLTLSAAEGEVSAALLEAAAARANSMLYPDDDELKAEAEAWERAAYAAAAKRDRLRREYEALVPFVRH